MTREQHAVGVAEKAVRLVCALVGGAKGQTTIYETLSRVINERVRNKADGADALNVVDVLTDELLEQLLAEIES